MACPADDALGRLVDGEVTDEERARLLAHVEGCEPCLAVVARAQDQAPGPLGYAVGATLGRYEVVALLGAGAMGVVYEARDLELHRTVALKVVRPDRALDDAAALGERLRAEARALARVSSPCVVAVYDIGTVGEDVFIAMERIDGPTLRGWVAERPRAPREVAAAFVQAGEGLAAAHEVGVVHRDFKPDNALVGRDGRTRVSDFGLARDGPAGPPKDPSGALSTVETRTLAGTPAYMAPEQREGLRATPSSDQYAFCVALVEALTGRRLTPREPLPRGLPSAVRRLVARGLAVAPEERYGSMRDLTAALAEFASPRPRWHFPVALLATAALGVGAAALVGARGATPCDVGAATMAPTWSPRRADAVSAVLRGRANGEVLRGNALPRLTAWSRRWASERDGSCRDAAAGARPRAAARDTCLELQRHRVDAYLRLVVAGDDGAVGRLVQVAQQLPEPSDCARATAEPGVSPPSPRAVALEHRVADAAGATLAGRLGDARRALLAVEAEALSAGLPRVRLHALLELGRLMSLGDFAEARRALRLAVPLSLEQHAGDALADALVAATDLAAHEGDLPLAEWLATTARGAIAALGGDPGRDAEIDLHLCEALQRAGASGARTRAACAHARERLVTAFGADDLRVAVADDQLGNVAYQEGRWQEALDAYDRALALQHRVLGTLRDNSEGNRAHVLIELGRSAEGEQLLLGLIARFPDRGYLHDGVAIARRSRGDFAGALGADQAALESCQRQGARGCLVWANVGLGEDLLGLGRYAEALEALERALAVGVAPGPVERARIELGRARVLLWQGDRPRAESTAAAAEAILDGAGAGAGPEASTRAALERLRALFLATGRASGRAPAGGARRRSPPPRGPGTRSGPGRPRGGGSPGGGP
ncbi:MAG: protein kinase [Deltaproteobacteria bacterium]|nr:protein kinase [Deltaproteobacteria bacterium]